MKPEIHFLLEMVKSIFTWEASLLLWPIPLSPVGMDIEKHVFGAGKKIKNQHRASFDHKTRDCTSAQLGLFSRACSAG